MTLWHLKMKWIKMREVLWPRNTFWYSNKNVYMDIYLDSDYIPILLLTYKLCFNDQRIKNAHNISKESLKWYTYITLLEILPVVCTFESCYRAEISLLHWALSFTLSGIYSSKDSFQWRKINDYVVLNFNKDIINIITFNWAKVLKYLVIPIAILPFHLSTFILIVVVLSYAATTLRVSPYSYWLNYLALKKVSSR